MIDFSGLRRLLKRRWVTLNLKLSSRDTSAMNLLYLVRDPWNLDQPIEHFRFNTTARMIREHIGTRFGSILEIGCGEGLQTAYFSSLADSVVAIDSSSLAIKRARQRRIKNATFDVADLSTYQLQVDKPFDLVTACEVMYYMADLEKTYASLNRLGNTCVATYCRARYSNLDQFFSSKSVQVHTISSPPSEWRFVWWRN